MTNLKGLKMFALIAVTSAFALTANAQSTTTTPPSSAATPPATDTNHTGQQEKQNQQDRIAQGVKSGSLTPGEASKLEEQQRNMGRTLDAERKANGGTLPPAEKHAAHQHAQQMSRDIHRDKHNARHD